MNPGTDGTKKRESACPSFACFGCHRSDECTVAALSCAPGCHHRRTHQLIAWLASTALEECAGSDSQNKLRQVLHSLCCVRCLPKLLDKLPFFNRQREFYQEKNWNEGLALLGFLRKCIHTNGYCSERAEKPYRLRKVKPKKNLNPKRIQNLFSNWSLI